MTAVSRLALTATICVVFPYWFVLAYMVCRALLHL